MSSPEQKGELSKQRNLGEMLKEYIAREYGVSPDDVTFEFIEEKRAELYADPKFRFEPDTEHGGWDPTGLEIWSPFEAEQKQKAADEILRRFTKKRKK